MWKRHILGFYLKISVKAGKSSKTLKMAGFYKNRKNGWKIPSQIWFRCWFFKKNFFKILKGLPYKRRCKKSGFFKNAGFCPMQMPLQKLQGFGSGVSDGHVGGYMPDFHAELNICHYCFGVYIGKKPRFYDFN